MSYKLSIKLVSGESFEVDAEDSSTVLTIKERIIEHQQYECEPDNIKLIFKGVNLPNESTLGNEKINSNSRIVCVVSKKIASNPVVESTPASEPSPHVIINTEMSARLQGMNYPQQDVEKALTVTNNNLSESKLLLSRVPSSLLLRLNKDDYIFKLALRYDYDQYMLLTKQNQVDFALSRLELIMPGIKQALSRRVEDLIELSKVAPKQTETTVTTEPIDNNNTPGHIADDIDPEDQYSDILRNISSMPDTEKREIMRDIGITDDVIDRLIIGQNTQNTQINNPTQNTNHDIQLTDEENQAIDRLVEIFCLTRRQTIEAYIVCDRNEELTANYLTENAFN